VGRANNIIACRQGSYGDYADRAFEHLASLGVRHVEIPVPSAERIDATAAELKRHGLSASTLHGECDPPREDISDLVASQMPAFEALGCRIMFASAQRGELPAETAYARLREAGDAAAAHGVTIVLETHPDLITNADVALETMRGVNHPNIRINFDTANLYFYNHEIDCVGQLRRVVNYVGAVHLKDTDGGYRNWHFPALGEGIVDFAGVFEVLDSAGFNGPCTLEIEGIEGEQRTESLVLGRIAASIEHLRELGRF
jgi:sugar phosphate isomerase/epimerase